MTLILWWRISSAFHDFVHHFRGGGIIHIYQGRSQLFYLQAVVNPGKYIQCRRSRSEESAFREKSEGCRLRSPCFTSSSSKPPSGPIKTATRILGTGAKVFFFPASVNFFEFGENFRFLSFVVPFRKFVRNHFDLHLLCIADGIFSCPSHRLLSE